MYQLEPHRERRLLWLLAFTQFTLIMDFMVMMPIGPLIMRAFDIGPAGFATAVSAYSWCAGLSGLFGATYIDRFDRRKLLLAAYALFLLSNLACALAPNFAMLLVGRAFAGITAGVIGSVVMTIISDVIPAPRRGAATGIVMTSFSIAAIAGVPAGVTLGAHFGWASPFFLLVLLSAAVWFACSQLVPSLTEHLAKVPTPLNRALPDLWHLGTQPNHLRAFVLTFVMMVGHMMVIPFISPSLVANHGVQPAQLGWMYMAGGAVTFFSSPIVGRLADRYGKRRIFTLFGILSFAPVLFVTHLPDLPFYAIVMFFPVFMVLLSGRMIPMQALITTVPEPRHRGAFLSLNSAIQSVGMGTGAWLGGLLLSSTPDGQLVGYGNIGYISVAAAMFGLIWVHTVKGFSHGKSDGAGQLGNSVPAVIQPVTTPAPQASGD
jgi:MFS transporter, DHA1 family, inner membrane transport protein